MSRKKIIATITLLTFGIIIVPGGFIINDFIQDLTYGSVDEGLRGIKDQGVPLVIEETLNLGPKALALTMDMLREQGMKYSTPIVDSAFFINQFYTFENQPILIMAIFVEYLFFSLNDSLVSETIEASDYPPLKGIAEWCGTELNFTSYGSTLYEDNGGGVQRLKYGVNATGWWGDRLPGFYEDTYRRVGDANWPPENYSDSVATVDVNQDRGFGVMEMMDLIENANDAQILELAGPSGYNLTDPDVIVPFNGEEYNKLEILYLYYNEYFRNEAFDLIIPKFNQPSNPPTFENPLWDAYPQYQMQDWNGYDTSYEDIALYSFIEQWAKCNNFDDGFEFHDAQPSIVPGLYGLEPGGPGNSSGIPMKAALQLWNKSNEYSLLNVDGIYKWYDAYTDNDTCDELLAEFSQYPGYEFENQTYGEFDWGFNQTDIDLLLNWLWGNGGGWNQGSFYYDVFPQLLTEDIAFQILLEQWAYGTIRGEVLYPGGFPLPLGSNIVYGLELGFQGAGQPVIPAEMSIDTAIALWDTSSEYSLTSKSGINKWLAAASGDSEAFSILQSEFELSDSDMYLLMQWLPNFQENVMPALAQFQYSLPADSITLGNILEVVFIGLGASCIGLGAMGMGGYITTRKATKTYKPKKKIDPFELGSKNQ